jgi:hypothetical protein
MGMPDQELPSGKPRRRSSSMLQRLAQEKADLASALHRLQLQNAALRLRQNVLVHLVRISKLGLQAMQQHLPQTDNEATEVQQRPWLAGLAAIAAAEQQLCKLFPELASPDAPLQRGAPPVCIPGSISSGLLDGGCLSLLEHSVRAILSNPSITSGVQQLETNQQTTNAVCAWAGELPSAWGAAPPSSHLPVLCWITCLHLCRSAPLLSQCTPQQCGVLWCAQGVRHQHAAPLSNQLMYEPLLLLDHHSS